nr:hypothetical protein [Tanacetum cinerariifolium]
MQTQTSNTLNNAIMEAGSKDRPPMLAPGNYVQWKSIIKRYIDTKPNHELIPHCLQNPPYKFTWSDMEVPISEGSHVTRTESQMETYKTVSQDIRDQLNAEAEAVQIILTGIDNDIYSTIDACPNACEMWKAIERSQQAVTRNRGKAIVNSPQPIYDQEPSMVAEDDETSKDKEIDKLVALISLSFKKIYKPTNNKLRTSSNTNRANQVNSPRINRSAGYENQRIGNVAGARETVAPESDEVIRLEKESRSKLSDLIRPFDYDKLNNLYDLFVPQREKSSEQRYFSERSRLSHTSVNNEKSKESFNKQATLLEKRMDESIPKHSFLNEIDRLSKEYYYADHMNAILGVYTKLDKDLKAQLQDKGIVISELKKLIEKLKGKSVDTKFEKSSIIRQPNAFKCQRPSILGKPNTFSNSFERKDFSKLKSVTQNNVSNDFSKPVTAQTLPPNKKSILKNTYVLALGMYKLHIEHNQARTSQLPQDSKKTNKRVSFSTRVIPITSVSRPQLKSNPMGDRVMRNNSQGKKQEVEDHRRNVKFSKNKTSLTACNDSLNAKTLNVNFVCATCDKCVLNEKHNMCVLNSVAKPLKKTVVSKSNQKPRNITKKLYERVSKTCSWWYPKFTPSGYK